MDRITPPSARAAAPLIAAASGLQTKATTAATSSCVVKRPQKGARAGVLKKLLLELALVATPFSAESRLTNSATPWDAVGPGSTAFTGTAVPAVASASPRDMASWSWS